MIKIYLTQPHEIYETSEGAEEFTQLKDTRYNQIYQLQKEFIDIGIKRINSHLPEKFDFIDLGPGDGNITQHWWEKLEDRVEKYVAVDVQESFLAIADEVSQRGIETEKHHMLLENFLALMPQAQRPRFFHLGMTYSNFSDNRMSALLHTCTTQQDCIWISAQKGPLNPSKGDLTPYQSITSLFEPLVKKYKLSGGRIKVKYDSDKSEVQAGYLVKNCFLIFAVSKKPDGIEFRREINSLFKGSFLETDKFLGFIGSTNQGDNYRAASCF